MSEFLITYDELKAKATSIKRIFFYRICGTGMGNCAVLLKSKGFEVEGADTDFFPPMGDYLERAQIATHHINNVTDEMMQSFDLIIVGNVVAKKSADAMRIEKLGVPYTSFPAALGSLVLEDKIVVGVAGTHGKTSTTYYLVQLFKKLGMDPGYLIGGVIDEGPSAHLGTDPIFFIESDEYDSAYFHKISKFHYYSINHLILTSLEFDHGDIFQGIEDIKNQFRGLFPKITHTFILCSDYPETLSLEREFKSQCGEQIKWFSYGEKDEMGPSDILMDKSGSCFTLKIDGQREIFRTNLVGIHNILNLSSAILFALSQGISVEKVKESIRLLQKVKRRQEERGYYKGALVIDDFGHHPTAVEITLKGLRVQYPDHKILAVFAPTSATSRSAIFEKEFAESLKLAHKVILVQPTIPTTIKNVGDINCQRMASLMIPTPLDSVPIVTTLDQLLKMVDAGIGEKGKDWVIVFFSNGHLLGLWESSFVQQLQN